VNLLQVYCLLYEFKLTQKPFEYEKHFSESDWANHTGKVGRIIRDMFMD